MIFLIKNQPDTNIESRQYIAESYPTQIPAYNHIQMYPGVYIYPPPMIAPPGKTLHYYKLLAIGEAQKHEFCELGLVRIKSTSIMTFA